MSERPGGAEAGPALPRWGLTEVAFGWVGALAAIVVVWPVVLQSAPPTWVLVAAATVLPLLPLLIAVLVARFAPRRRLAGAELGLRTGPIELVIDLGVGIGAGILLRIGVDLVSGVLGNGAVSFVPDTIDPLWMFAGVLAPVLLAPVVEELFFRSLALRALQRWWTGSRHGRWAGAPSGASPGASSPWRPWSRGGLGAIAASSLLFAVLHVANTGGVAWPWVLASMTVVGATFAVLAAATGRLWSALVAHVVFNAAAIGGTLLAALR